MIKEKDIRGKGAGEKDFFDPQIFADLH